MAYKFIYGPNGTDKTQKCMNMIERCRGHYRKIFYVVPEYLSFFAEKKVSALFGGVSEGGVDVTSFKKLYCETVNITGEEKAKKLTSGGVRIVMAYICTKLKKELRILGRAAANPGFSEIMAKAVSEFKTYNVSPQDLLDASEKATPSLKMKLEDIEKIYSAYETFIGGRFSDAQDELEILKTKIAENPGLYEKCLFVFDGYQIFTPDQLGVIAKLSENCDMAFAFTEDDVDGTSGDTYVTQGRTIKKLRKILATAEEKEAERAEKYKSAIPENDYILSNLLYGKTEKFSGVPENIEIHEFSDQHAETEFVAEEIIRLVKSGARYKDITVIARDGDRYLPVIESLFKDYDIPVFIDKKMGAANQPAINAVIAALDVLRENFSYESVFEYLKTGFSNLDSFETDLLENYIVATGIRGKSWFKEWKYTPYVAAIFESNEEFIERINQIRLKVTEPLERLKEGLAASATVEEKCRNVFEFINEIALFEKINGMVERFKQTEPQTAAYYGRVWSLLLKTLDETVEVIGDKKIGTDDFIILFVRGLSMHEISIVPTSADAVSVVKPENMSEQPEKYVFVVGANDGVYPSAASSEGLLSDRDRNMLMDIGVELAQDTVSRAFGENYIILKTFMSAQNKLLISYPIGDVGGTGARFVSVTVRRIKSSFPELETKSHVTFGGNYGDDRIVKPKPAFGKYAANYCSKQELSDMWLQVGEWYKNSDEWSEKHRLLEDATQFKPKATNLEKSVTDRLYEKGLNLSVSSMEQYTHCPFAYFANYTLKLKTREIPDITSADAGTLMHQVIENLSSSIIKNGYNWKTVPSDFLERETIRISDEIIIRLESELDTESVRRMRLLARIKEMIEESVRYISEHLKAGEFEPLGYEIEFGEGKQYGTIAFDIGGKKVRLRGKVDRADIYVDEEGRRFVRVIDYKSGDKSFDYSSMFYGLQMQLVLYLDRICDETDASPAGILYFRLFDPSVDKLPDAPESEIAGEIESMHKMSGVVLDDDEIISAMDKSSEKESRIIPVKRNNDGSLSKSSSVITSAGFRDMQRHINRLIKKIGKDIVSGKNDVLPMSYGQMKGCTYCDFKKICLFDEHCGGKYNELEKLTKQDVLDKIGKEGAEND